MKKFVFITLVFALTAGAAFAQDGEWSIGGRGEIGTMLNFVPRNEKDKMELERTGGVLLTDNDKPLTLIGAHGYNYPNWYGGIGAEAEAKYTRDSLSAGLTFTMFIADVNLGAFVQYDDGTRAFQLATNVRNLLNGGTPNFEAGRLWGWYKFLDGAIHLEAAADGRDTNYWFSNDVLADLFSWSKILYVGSAGEEMDFGMGFTKVDHHNYLLTDIAPGAISGLSFGLMVPGVFAAAGLGDNPNKWQAYQSYGWSQPGAINYQNNMNYRLWVDESLLRSRLGVKFATGPLDLSLQFAMLGKQIKQEVWKEDGDDELWNLRKVVEGKNEDKGWDGVEKEILLTGLYFGGKFNINDNLSAGLGFQGIFHSKEPELGFGANVGFSTGPFAASLLLGLHTKIVPGDRWYPVVKTESVDGAPDEVYGKGGDVYKEFDGNLTIAQDMDAGLKEEGSSSPFRQGGFNRKNAVNDTTIGVKPRFTFNIVENYLAVSLESYLYWKIKEEFYDTVDGMDVYFNQRAYQHEVFGFQITPEIWFNVAGTGAGAGYWWPNTTAIIVRYNIGGWFAGKELRSIYKSYNRYEDVNYGNPKFNQLDITFKWAF